MFREVSSNSYSIAAIFGEHTGDFNKPKIIGLDQSFLKQKPETFAQADTTILCNN